VANYIDTDVKKTIKALLYQAEGKYIAAFIRGDRELNLVKLVNALNIPEHAIEFAEEEEMAKVCGCVGGYTGPMGLKNCTIVVDTELVGMKNMLGGANKENYHVKNVNYGRDYTGEIVKDLKMIKTSDRCPKCQSPVKMTRGIEVGQVFKLGTKYSDAMKAYYKDEDMKEKAIVMGCYGIGVTRTMAAVVEQHHDKDGIIWPMAVAPYHVIITLVNINDPVQAALAEDIHTQLLNAGIEVMLDDREERPGVKFKDADLLGIPIRITVGKKAAEGLIEFKLRRDQEIIELDAANGITRAIETVRSEIKKDGVRAADSKY
jgi:prolyl-tRNA synthetase